MEYRRLGSSGFTVPVLSLGTGTFGGKGMLQGLGLVGRQGGATPDRYLPRCGSQLFDSADVYSAGEAEGILGGAIKGLSRDRSHHFHQGDLPLRRGAQMMSARRGIT